MRRYNITPHAYEEGTVIPAKDAVPRIHIAEAPNGEWVRYEDALLAERRVVQAKAVLTDMRRRQTAILRDMGQMKRDFQTLIRKYAEQVGACEGVTFLEDQYRELYSDHPIFTDEEWQLLRSIAGVTDD